MKAAVVTAFDRPPQYADHPEPVARGADEVVVDVLAAGLHPRVRSQADGSHYTSRGALPLVPGIDAVVRGPDGKLRYTILDDTQLGTMAERTVIELDRSVVLPANIDPVAVAAAMNPLLSSWMALRYRTSFRSGQRVLILGATGSAGRMAIQVAKRFGAKQIFAAGRDPARLAELRALGADEVLPFDQAARAADVDVVIDYVWGEPAVRAMVAMLTARADRGAALTWIAVGSVGGLEAAIPSAALRQARLEIVGSGLGSIPGRDFIKELPAMAAAVRDGKLDVRARAVKLADVTAAWTTPSSDRIVLVP